MRSDRYKNVILAVIAVCLLALALTAVGLPGFAARAEATVDIAARDAYRGHQKPGGEAVEPRGPKSTLPLRWRVPAAHENVDSDETYCSTVVSVLNVTSATVNVDVEWMWWNDDSEARRPMAVPARSMMQWATNDEINLSPHYADDVANLAILHGYANVNADDPRILVTATVLCRDGTAAGAKIVSQNDVPAFPVGATAQFFQAGMPATWTPPMTAPDLSETPR
jgi:hypothetical protein